MTTPTRDLRPNLSRRFFAFIVCLDPLVRSPGSIPWFDPLRQSRAPILIERLPLK
jgi:hypothetical protein